LVEILEFVAYRTNANSI